MKSPFNTLWMGAILGLIAPWMVVIIFYNLKFSHLKFGDFIEISYLNQVFTPLISLSALLNLGVFYLFIWTQKDHSARGVLAATFIYAIAIFIFKLSTPSYNINF
jgi:hypothetical protein